MELHVLVRGSVQGVGFRWFVRQTARELGLVGWVRNNGDGSVEVAAKGEAAAIEQLRRQLLQGPSGARVSGLEPLEPLDQLDPVAEPLTNPFTIMR